MRILLSDIFDEKAIKLNLEGSTKEAVFAELCEAAAETHPEIDREETLNAIWERENIMSTGISNGAAVPHASCPGVGKMAGAIGISRSGIEYEAPDNKPVHVVFMLIIGEPAHENHLRILNQISRLVKSESLALLKNAETAREAHDILSRFL